jgi:hypothetical protein
MTQPRMTAEELQGIRETAEQPWAADSIVRRLLRELDALRAELNSLVPAGADLKASPCGCLPEKRNYNNPFHRLYVRVKHCDRHSEESVALLERTIQAARGWRRCDTHGDIDGATQWGCPDCVAQLRRELADCERIRANSAHCERIRANSAHKGWEHAAERIASLERDLQAARDTIANCALFLLKDSTEFQVALKTAKSTPE